MKRAPNIVVILFLTTLTTIMWIGFSVYQALNTPADTKVTSEISNPLNPTIDIKTVDLIEQKIENKVSNFVGTEVAQTTTQVKPQTPVTTPLATTPAPETINSDEPDTTPTLIPIENQEP